MIVQKNFLNKLKDFGLNSYESKIWAALLTRGISTAGELSDISNVPRSRSYDVLESLEKKGFIIMKIGKPIKYIAVSPEEVLDRVKKRIKIDTESRLKIIEEIQDSKVIGELSMLYKQGIDFIEPTELSGCFRGRNNIYNHLIYLIKEAKSNIILVTSAEGLTRKKESLYKHLEKASKRGVDIKIVAPLKTTDSKKTAKELSKIADVRHSDEAFRFCVVDDKHLTFMLIDDKEVQSSYDTAVWVNSPFFVSNFKRMFDQTWKGLNKA